MVNKQRIIDEFIELAKIDSLSLHERAMCDVLKQKLRAAGAEPHEDGAGSAIGGDTGNLYAVLKGDLALPGILLSSHIDTVTPANGKKPRLDGDTVKSDGTTIVGADDLAGVVSILETIRELKEEGSRHGDVFIVFSVAEEIGLLGAANFDYSRFRTSMGIILDSTGNIGNVASSAPSHKRLNITIKGKAAHAGVEPEKGISAVRIAARAIDRMKLGRVDDKTTANVVFIEGGSATNIIPETAVLKAECRCQNEPGLQAQLEHMIACVREAAQFYGGSADISVISEYTSFSIDPESPQIKLAREAIEAAGLKMELFASGGGSDANIINNRGIMTLNMGAGMHNVHSVNEYADIGEMTKSVEVLKYIITHSGGRL